MALIGIGACAAVAALVATASALLCRRFWRADPWLSVPCGLAGLALVCLVTFFAWLPGPALGSAAAHAAVLACLAVCGRHVLALPPGRRTELVAAAVARLVPFTVVAVGLVLVTMGLTYLWTARADLFLLSANRYIPQLPWDNELQAIISHRLADGLDPRGQLSSWLTSDRPPLQSGLQLLTVPVVDWLPLERPALLAHASVTAQLIWVPAAYALCRSLGYAPRVALVACAFAGLSGTALVNTVFTWPKVMCAGFLIAALAVALHSRARPRTGEAVLLAVLTAAGALSHGSGVFFVPVLVAVLVWRRLRALRPGFAAAGAATAVLTYAPWVAYQRFYDPPGTRLLYYQLAGVKEIVTEPILSMLVRRYAEAGWSGTLANKRANLALPVSEGPFDAMSLTGVNVYERRASEFFVLASALGWATVPLVALLCVAVVRALRGQQNPRDVRVVVGLAISSVASLLVWALVLWGPGTTWLHVSPLAPLFVAYLLPTAWLVRRSRLLGSLLLLLQGALLIATYAPGATGGGPVTWGALTAVVLGIGALLLGLGLAPGEPAEAPEEQWAPPHEHGPEDDGLLEPYAGWDSTGPIDETQRIPAWSR